MRGPRGRSPHEAERPDDPSEAVSSLVARGVSEKVAAELAAAHSAEAIRARVEVFDWLRARSDKKLAKNPAGYLVASIRDGYAAPEGFAPPDEADRLAEAERQAAEDEHQRRKVERDEADKAARREAEVKARWAALTDGEREEIAAQVKAENPGLRRWKTMMEPLCLAELERRMDGGQPKRRGPSQGSLFPDSKPSK